MRLALAAAALACSSPALATGGFECRPAAGRGPTVTLAVGHAVAPRPFAATLRDGRVVPVAVGQSWIDERYLWVDLVDPNALRFEAKLRAAFQPKLRGRPALGILVRRGRTYKMRCVEA